MEEGDYMANSLKGEYKKLLDRKVRIESEMPKLAYGYISRKTIRNKPYLYLQKRLSGKVVSQYIKSNEVKEITRQVAIRKKYEAELPKINARLKELEQAALILDKTISRELMLLKICAGMDSIDADQKQCSSYFASAMNAIEGIHVSEQTAKDINDWQKGNKPFLIIFEDTLKRYGIDLEV